MPASFDTKAVLSGSSRIDHPCDVVAAADAFMVRSTYSGIFSRIARWPESVDGASVWSLYGIRVLAVELGGALVLDEASVLEWALVLVLV
jgi:hypothetical protein